MGQDSFSVADIAGDPTLDTHVVAGAAGTNRTVIWAHSCEFTDPHRWLGPHELLMTTGLGIPSGSNPQKEFIANLDRAGLAGVAIGMDGIAPRLTKAMIAEADARSFPILRTGSTTPFAAIGRTVAASNSDKQTMKVLLLAKLYQIAGQQDEKGRRSGSRLGELFRTALTVVDAATGCVVIGSGTLAPEGFRAHRLRTYRDTYLLLDPKAEIDGFSLMHLVQVLTVDTNVVLQDQLARITEGSRALEGALANERAASTRIARIWDTESPAFFVAVTQCDVPGRVLLACVLRGIPGTIVESQDRYIIAVPSEYLATLEVLAEELDLTVGVSREHFDLQDLAGAAAEASEEFEVAQSRDEPWRVYAGRQLSLLSRSQSEARQIARMVLGSISESDDKSSVLRETLFALLDNDLHWGRTAAQLNIHRQTLIYRMNTVERITGRSVRRMKDLGELWLAQTAWKQTRVCCTDG